MKKQLQKCLTLTLALALLLPFCRWPAAEETSDDPVAFTVENVTLLEGSGDLQEDGSYRYYSNNYTPHYSLTMADGTVYQSNNYGYLTIGDREYFLLTTELQPQDQAAWQAGHSYPVAAQLYCNDRAAGVSMRFPELETEFTVTIAESPVEAFSVEEVSLLDKPVDNYDQHGYERIPFTYSLRLKNGQTLTDTAIASYSSYPFERYSAYIQMEGNDYPCTVTFEQPTTEWVAGQRYRGEARLLAKAASFSVTVTPNPKAVTGLEIEDTAVLFGLPMTERDIYAPDFSLLLADGSKIHSNNGRVNKYQTLQYTYPDKLEWKLGDVYTVTGRYGAFSDTFKIRVVDNGVVSMDFADVTVVENADTVYSFESTFVYHYTPACTATFRDGTRHTFHFPTGGLELPLDSYRTWGTGGGPAIIGRFPTCTDNQAEEPWQVGHTYTATASFLNFSGDIRVTVVPSPVKRIIPHAMTYVADTNDWYEAGTLQGWYESFPFTVELNDGRKIESNWDADSAYVVLDDNRYTLDAEFDTPDLPAAGTTGSLPCRVTVLGKTVDLKIPVTVVQNEQQLVRSVLPGVTGIRVADVRVWPGVYWNPEYSFVLQNGKEVPADSLPGLSDYALRVEDHTFTADQIGQTIKLTASAFGFSDEFSVTVIENPIAGLAVSDVTDPLDEQNLFSGFLHYDKAAGTFRWSTPLGINEPFVFRLKDGSTVTTDCQSTHSYGGWYSSHTFTLYHNRFSVSYDLDETAYEKDVGKPITGRVSVSMGYGNDGDEQPTFPFTVTFTAAPAGDLNGDGRVNAGDALNVLRAAVGKTTLTAQQRLAADMNRDGAVNAVDALLILRKAVGK